MLLLKSVELHAVLHWTPADPGSGAVAALTGTVAPARRRCRVAGSYRSSRQYRGSRGRRRPDTDAPPRNHPPHPFLRYRCGRAEGQAMGPSSCAVPIAVENCRIRRRRQHHTIRRSSLLGHTGAPRAPSEDTDRDNAVQLRRDLASSVEVSKAHPARDDGVAEMTRLPALTGRTQRRLPRAPVAPGTARRRSRLANRRLVICARLTLRAPPTRL